MRRNLLTLLCLFSLVSFASADDLALPEGIKNTQNVKDVPLTPQEVTAGLEHRRIAAEREPTEDELDARLTLGEVPQVAPAEVVEFKRNGIQDGVFTKLRQGRYPIEARLDLHRKTVKEARVEVFRFLQTSLDYGVRTLLISHGKGEKSDTPGRLKSHVGHWLLQVPQVIAFHSAQPRHGGYGAVYALLQKTEAKRVETREQHGQKGVRS